MAQQEGGWPLGLVQGVGMQQQQQGRNGPDFSGSISFNTLLTASPTCSSASSSDLDTQSTGSFFHDKSITLGSLIGVGSIVELSRRSFRGRQVTESNRNNNRSNKMWFFSLCSKNSVETQNVISPSSLAHFLAVERKANSGTGTTNQNSHMFIDAHPVTEQNSLFVDGHVAPPPPWFASDSVSLDHSNHGGPVLFSCICCSHPTC